MPPRSLVEFQVRASQPSSQLHPQKYTPNLLLKSLSTRHQNGRELTQCLIFNRSSFSIQICQLVKAKLNSKIWEKLDQAPPGDGKGI
jgi:hypothetical protein